MLTADQTHPSFGVQMGDHNYPQSDLPNHVLALIIPDIIDDDSSTQVRNQMVKAIEDLLPFLSQSKYSHDKSILFGEYVDSVSILKHCRDEVRQLFRAMIETVLEIDFEGALSADVQSEILSETMKDADIQLSSPENLATAEIASFEPNRIQTLLQASLRKSASKLVAELMDGLGVLVDRSVAGLHHWPSPNSVKYHFFRRRIAQTSVRVTKKRGRVQRRTEEEARGDFRQWKRVHERKTTSQVTCWLVHHKHETTNAIRTSLKNSKVIMPVFVQDLVKQIPDWMRPSIYVIDGYLIQETILEREVSQREFSQVELEEELLHGHEPAVCLGSFVLTGWGPRDIELELERREKEAAIAAQEQGSRIWSVSAVICQVLCFLFGYLGMVSPSIFLFIGGIVSIAMWIAYANQRTKKQLSELAQLRICLGFIMSLGGLQLLFTPLSISLVLTGIGLLIVGTGILSIDRGVLFRSSDSKS